MKWNNKDACKFFLDSTAHLPAKHTSATHKCKIAATRFMAGHLPSGDVKLLTIRFCRLLESTPNHKASEYIMKAWEEKIFFECPPLEEKKQKGTPSVTLGEGPPHKKKRSILIDMITAIEDFATKQNVSKQDALIMIAKECNRAWSSS